MRAYPDRIEAQALAHVPTSGRSRSDPDWAIAELDHAINDFRGLHGLQLLPDHMALYGQSTAWDADALTPAAVGPLRHAGPCPSS